MQFLPIASIAIAFLTVPAAASALGFQITADEDVSVAATQAIADGDQLNHWTRSARRAGDLFLVLGGTGATGGLEVPTLPGGQASLRAIDGNGAEVWEWRNDNPYDQLSQLAVTASGDRAFLAGRINGVVNGSLVNASVAVRVDEGQRAWRLVLPTNNITESFIDCAANGQRVFLAHRHINHTSRLYSLNPSDGSILWETPLVGSSYRVAAVATDASGARVHVLLLAAVGSLSDVVLTFDGATGGFLWDSGLAPVFGGSADPEFLVVTPDGSRVFVGAQAATPNGPRLASLDGATGVAQWILNPPGGTGSGVHGIAAMAFDPAGPDLFVITRQGNHLNEAPLVASAIRPVGVVKWSTPLPSTYNVNWPPSSGFSLAFDDTRVYFGARRGWAPGEPFTIGALNREGGALLWHADLEPPITTSAAVSGLGSIPVAGEMRLLWGGWGDGGASHTVFRHGGHDAADGTLLWTDAHEFEVSTPRALALSQATPSARLFVQSTSLANARRVTALEADSLAPLWQTELSSGRNLLFASGSASPLAHTADGSVVFAARPGASTQSPPPAIDALDGTNGQVLWTKTFTGESPPSGNPTHLGVADVAALGGEVLYSLHDGPGSVTSRTAMRATRIVDGATLWHEDLSGPGALYWRAGPMALDQGSGRIYGLLAAQGNAQERQMRALVRDMASGALLTDYVVSDSAFAPGPTPGNPLPLDLLLDTAGDRLYLLGEYLGGVSQPRTLGVAAFAIGSGQLLWVRSIEPTEGIVGTAGWLHLALDGQVLGVAARAQVGLEPDGALAFGLSTADGSTLWETRIADDTQPLNLLSTALDPTGRTLSLGLAPLSGAAEVRTLDLATGTFLWQATVGSSASADRARVLRTTEAGLQVLTDVALFSPEQAMQLVSLETGPLVSGPDAISLGAPEPVVFLLDRPQASAGQIYLLLGSASGTTPGLPLAPGVVLPLEFDAYFQFSLQSAGSPPFVGTLGLLGSAGNARATLNLPPGLPPSLAGATLHHAFVEVGLSGPVFASPPATLQLVP